MHATFDPPYIMFAANLKEDGSSKDNVVNIQRTQEFCWSLGGFASTCRLPTCLSGADRLADALSDVRLARRDEQIVDRSSVRRRRVRIGRVREAVRQHCQVSHGQALSGQGATCRQQLARLSRPDRGILVCPQFECKFHSTFRLPGNSPTASVDVRAWRRTLRDPSTRLVSIH
jgi:hypothetical protein